MRECSRGNIREGTFVRGDLQGHRTVLKGGWGGGGGGGGGGK